LDVHILPKKSETQKKLVSETKKSEEPVAVEVYDRNLGDESDLVDESLEDEFRKDVERFEGSFYEPGSSEQREKLAKMIVDFLRHYANSPFKTEVDILVQALLANPSQGMLIHGLTLCRDIVRSWDE
jgi:hypothetical protein